MHKMNLNFRKIYRYNAEWYNMPVMTRKLLIMIMINSKKPLIVSVGHKFIALSYVTFNAVSNYFLIIICHFVIKIKIFCLRYCGCRCHTSCYCDLCSKIYNNEKCYIYIIDQHYNLIYIDSS